MLAVLLGLVVTLDQVKLGGQVSKPRQRCQAVLFAVPLVQIFTNLQTKEELQRIIENLITLKS